MLSLLLHSLTSVCLLSVPAQVSAVTTETVVGVAGKKVMLPCHAEGAGQGGVEVCWGRGQPSLFTCHNTVINTAGDQTTYRKSYRYSTSSSLSLSILSTRPSDAGFYHCRVQLPGLFNDQMSTVHLILIRPYSTVSEPSDREDAGNLNTPQTAAAFTCTGATERTGNDVTEDNTTGPVMAQVQTSVQQLVDRLQIYVGNTVRLSFIVFIPALLLTAAHRVWRANRRADPDRRLNQSEEEEDSSV